MKPHTYTLILELGDKLVPSNSKPINIEPHYKEVPGMLVGIGRRLKGHESWDIGEKLKIVFCKKASSFVEICKLFKLVQPDGCLDIKHIVLEARLHHLVLGASSL